MTTTNKQVTNEIKYQISMKKGYQVLYIVMTIFFLIFTIYFAILSFSSSIETILFGLIFTIIFFIFLIYSLYGLTKKCTRLKGKVIYSCLFINKEYNLADITYSKTETEEFYKDNYDGVISQSHDKVTTFYNKSGQKLFKFGLAYQNVNLLIKDINNIQKSIKNKK